MPNSNNTLSKQIEDAVATIRRGGIIAYPTEAVYGLGCDPFSQQAVMQLLQLKHRAVNKGLILITDDFEKVEPLTQPINSALLKKAQVTWPGPVTWVFPASDKAPLWIRGDFDSIAIRVTDHPIAREICQRYGKPIVSTSANSEGAPPAKDSQTVVRYFGDHVNIIAAGKIGELSTPTPIYDVATGQQLR